MTAPLRNSRDGLKTDLYELTMAAGYFHNHVETTAAFELSCHTMPENRSFLLACGLQQVVEYILNLRFTKEDIDFLKALPVFKHVQTGFFDYLKDFHFSGDVWAMPEGEIFFAREPVIQVEAPIIEAQILETYLLSIMNIESLVATKAARVVQAACCDGIQRGVVDFGSRRAHGPEAGVLAARAAYMAGCLGTSNVYAGRQFGIPVYGTMAHSWVEAFDSEEESFESYHKVFPENTILLIDTYDTVRCIQKIVKMPLKDKLQGVRLDSGDLKTLSKKVREILDRAGLSQVKILASGNLNEYKIAGLIRGQAPIDLFGVGTDMATSRDYPAMDLTYKLAQIKDAKGNIQYKAKYSPQKTTVPGRKQVFRRYDKNGFIEDDIIGLSGEDNPSKTQPLLRPVIRQGVLVEPLPVLEETRRNIQKRLAGFPPSLLRLDAGVSLIPGYTERISKMTKANALMKKG
jgi:nicotinate phosphoribosyltransferase